MNKFSNPLKNIKIASPCSADWEQMLGNDRQRFCGECKLNVYNLSGMTRTEAENLLIESEGRLCVRFYKRSDGTVLTKDCPVGWQAIKHRVSRMAAAVASLVFGILSGLGINGYFNQSNQSNVMGKMTYVPSSEKTEKPIEPMTGVIAITPVKKEEVQWLGRVEADLPVAGGIMNVDEVRQQIKKKRRHYSTTIRDKQRKD